jgi:hypothetical protein
MSSKIDLMIDEENELTFQVNIQGTRPGSAKCRLMLESKGMSLAFEGHNTGDEVSVVLPPLDHVLSEGVYDMTLEVVVDDRYFEPLKIQGEFEKRLKVTAEAVKVKSKPRVSTSASLLEVKKSKPSNAGIVNISSNSTRKTKPVNRKISESKNKSTEVISDKDIWNLIEKLGRRK